MKIEDYLHLYLGSNLKCARMGEERKDFVMTGISYDDTQRIWWVYFENEESGYSIICDVFPILRKLSDMTREEAEEFNCIYPLPKTYKFVKEKWTFKEVKLLLSKHFDLFQLIESGLAIDKATLKTT